MNLFTKQKQTHSLREGTYGSQAEGRVREFGMDMYTLLYLKWVTSKNQCIAQGTLLSVKRQSG